MVTDTDRLRIVYELDDKPAAAGFKRVEAAMNRANAEIKRGAEESKRAVGKLGEEAAGLKDRFDPAYASARKFREEAAKLNKLYDAGGLGSKEYQQQIEALAAKFGFVENRSRRFGGSLQQVGFQVGDFATQVGAGTSATQALGQQLPQLLGAFGTFGALAGAAAAIMIPLGSALVKTALDSETLEDRMKDLEASTDAMADAAELAAMPLTKLRDLYGDLAENVHQSAREMSAFAAIKAERDAISTTRALSEAIGFKIPDVVAAQPLQWNGQVNLDRQRMALEAQANAVEDLRKKTGATEEQFERLQMAINRTNSSNSLEAAANDATNLAQVLAEIGQNDGIGDAQFRRLSDWAAQAQAVAAQSLRQIEAEKSARARLLDEYDATTRKMASLADDLKKAEAERAKSLAANNAEEVLQWDRVITKIREMVHETKAASSATDTLFERMSKGARGFLDQAADFAAGAAGRMSSSNAISIGKEYAGMKERPNREELKNLVGVDPATVAWCAAFMNAVLDKAGGKGTGSLAARSFLNWGTATDNPNYGDVVVLKRGNSRTAGHVGFYEGANPDGTIRVFGGNQSDGVGTANFKANDVLGYRRAPAPDRYVDPQTAAEAERIAIAGERAAKAEKEQKRLGSENAANLKKEVADRERKAKAVEAARKAMSESLISQQKAAELEAQRSDLIAAINASGGTDQQKAAAIAQVNAEMQRQITVMALTEEAKRRQVDLDTQMVGSSMTYRQAIEALGNAKAQQVVADEQAAAAADRLKQSQEFAAQQTQALKDGLVNAIIEGENFSDVLANVAQALAKAALQAALFNEGPMANGGGLMNLFGGLFGGGRGGDALSQALRGAIGARALGGPVSAGSPYLVGERGPEIIVPRSAGQVIPNHKLGGMTFAPSTSIIVQGNADERTLMLMRHELDARDRRLARVLPGQVQTINRDPLRR